MNMIEFIKSCGYRVFMRPAGPFGEHEFCFYTDQAGEKIAYCQWSHHAPSVSSVHVPNRTSGTGYRVADEVTQETLENALRCVYPYWEYPANGATVEKWKSWDAFTRSCAFNAEFKEV